MSGIVVVLVLVVGRFCEKAEFENEDDDEDDEEKGAQVL